MVDPIPFPLHWDEPEAPPEPWGAFFPGDLLQRPKPREWIVDGVVPRKHVVLMSGAPKVAKSLLLLQMLTSVAIGMPWIGFHTEKVKVLGIFCEDDKDELARRQFSIAESYGFDISLLDTNLELNPRDGLSTRLVTFKRYSDTPIWTPLWHDLWRNVAEYGYQLIGLDPTTLIIGGDSSNNPERIYVVITEMRKQLAKFDAALVLTNHTNRREPRSFAGPNAWHGAVRAAINLSMAEDPQTREPIKGQRLLTDLGGNYANMFDPIYLEWREGVLERIQQPALEKRPQTAQERLEFKYQVLSYLSKAVRRGSLVPIDDANAESLPRRIRRAQPGIAINDILHAIEQLLEGGHAVLASVKGRCMIRPKDEPYKEESPWKA